MSISSTDQKLDNTQIYFNSKDRDSGTNETPTFNFSSSIDRVSFIRIVSVEVPFSFYAITSTNNTIDFKDNGGGTLQATITAGNYTISELLSALKTSMQAVGGGTYTLTYSTSTNKITVATSLTTIEILTSSTIATVIGVDGTEGAAISVTMANTFSISGPNFLLLKSSNLSAQKVGGNVSTSSVDDLIHKIPINVGAGFLIVLFPFENLIRYSIRQTFSSVSFELTDPDGTTIDLNGLSWSITLSFVRQ